jgi:hypothetical protein
MRPRPRPRESTGGRCVELPRAAKSASARMALAVGFGGSYERAGQGDHIRIEGFLVPLGEGKGPKAKGKGNIGL